MESAKSNTGVRQQVAELFYDVEHEVEREVAEPHDLSQSDSLIRNHVTGISVSLFVLIEIFLAAVIIGIALYSHR